MCLILFRWLDHPNYPLLLAANRDEFYTRPTAEASFWEDAPDLLGGRDLKAGGTWMGITRGGRFAAVTNYREPGRDVPPNAKSRGDLVAGFLLSKSDPLAYLGDLGGEAYAGFNLLVGDLRQGELAYFSNRGDPPRRVEPGCHGVSNHLLDTPWPKVREGKAALSALGDPAPEDLLATLADRTPAPFAELPATGVGRLQERILSPRFIVAPLYGTRASTALAVDDQGRVAFLERSFNALGNAKGDAVHRFELRAGVA